MNLGPLDSHQPQKLQCTFTNQRNTQVLPLTLSVASAGQTKIFDKDVFLTLFF